MKKYFISIITCILLLFVGTSVYATQTKSDNFSRAYALTGNGANDIVAIANAQYTKTGANLGYTEAWCADFISDCAKLANQSAAIPFYGGVSGLRDRIISAGGSQVSGIPQVGDIAFMDWSGNGGYGHVEIVMAVSGTTVTTIGGNSGRNTSSCSTSEVWKHTYAYNHSYFTCFVRPKYSGSSSTQPSSYNPQGNVDVVTGGKGTIRVAGWAFDRDSSSKSLGIHVYAGKTGPTEWIGACDANQGSTDVTAAFGVSGSHRFDHTFSTSLNGTYNIYVYAINIGGGSNVLIGQKSVTITQPYSPQVYFDIFEGGTGTIRVAGWAFDRDDLSKALSISIYVDSTAATNKIATITANKCRTDVNSAYPGVGNYHGFDATINTSLVGGRYIYVCVSSVGGGEDAQILKLVTITKKASAAKSNQTISANCFIKKYGDSAFSIGAKTSGNGTLTYSSDNSKVATVSSSGKVTIKGIGIANIKIKASGTSTYNEATKIITVTVNPKSTSISSLKNSKSKKLTITWKKDTTVTGYKIQVATNSSFSNAKTYTVSSYKTVSKTLSVTKGKTYYVRVCTYKGVLSSSWGSVKSIKIKK